jgi:hypothetical protein
MTPDLQIEIQRQRSGQWATINKTGHHISYIEGPGATNTPPPSEPMVITDSCIVPLDRGLNKYRIVMTVPAKIQSKEVSANLYSNNNKHQLFSEKDNYIRFNKDVFFCINDSTGKQVWKPGTGRMINTSKFKEGLYYIVVYPEIYEFYKK